MTTNLVLTILADDRPGLVERLSATISAHGGSWQDASMAHLAGKFAGILLVQVSTPQVAQLEQELIGLPGLKVTVERARVDTPAYSRQLSLKLVGHDRIGIVREVAQVLASFAINVAELSTQVSSAPMSAEALFQAEARLQAPATLDAAALKHALEQLSDDMMVDITLAEAL
jgi:glycine cleavage system regulatory protein